MSVGPVLSENRDEARLQVFRAVQKYPRELVVKLAEYMWRDAGCPWVLLEDDYPGDDGREAVFQVLSLLNDLGDDGSITVVYSSELSYDHEKFERSVEETTRFPSALDLGRAIRRYRVNGHRILFEELRWSYIVDPSEEDDECAGVGDEHVEQPELGEDAPQNLRSLSPKVAEGQELFVNFSRRLATAQLERGLTEAKKYRPVGKTADCIRWAKNNAVSSAPPSPPAPVEGNDDYDEGLGDGALGSLLTGGGTSDIMNESWWPSWWGTYQE